MRGCFRDTISITFFCDIMLRRGVLSLSRYALLFSPHLLHKVFFASPCCVVAFRTFSRYAWFFSRHLLHNVFCVTLLGRSVSYLFSIWVAFCDTVYINVFCVTLPGRIFLDMRGFICDTIYINVFFVTPSCVVAFRPCLDMRGFSSRHLLDNGILRHLARS